MIDLYYTVLKARLQAQSLNLKYVDWYLGQPDDDGSEGLVRDTPCAFIEFGPFQWESRQKGVQIARGLSIHIHDVGSSLYESDQRLVGGTDHLLFAEVTYRALQGFRANLSDVPGFEALADTDDDEVLFESMTRIRTFTDQQLTRFTRTVQEFQTTVYDFSALPQYQEVVAQLNLQVNYQ